MATNELLAVADGVGGWNKRGVDPGLFSKELCKNITEDYLKLKALGKRTFEINLK